MATYNDATLSYDEVDVLYDGLVLDDFNLIVGGVDYTDYLADRSLRTRIGSHGNSLGTLDGIFNNPPSIPALGTPVRLYVDFVTQFNGDLVVTDLTEYKGNYVFVNFSAQDEGPTDDGIPEPAPFNISDDPDGVTTIGYQSMTVQNRTTEGGAPVQTISVVIFEDGFIPGMNVEVTNDNYGFVAEEFTINEVQAEWPQADGPRYTLTLGEPSIRLKEVVEQGELPDRSITSLKLAEDVTVPNVENDPSTVVISDTGLTVTGGAITVKNADATVIIDGTSNMFKIAATGTLSLTEPGGGATDTFTTVTLSSLGNFAEVPMILGMVQAYVSGAGVPSSVRMVGSIIEGAGGGGAFSTINIGMLRGYLDSNDELVVNLAVSNNTGSTYVFKTRYYVLEEAGL